MRDYTKTMPKWQVISETSEVSGRAAIFVFTSHQTSYYF